MQIKAWKWLTVLAVVPMSLAPAVFAAPAAATCSAPKAVMNAWASTSSISAARRPNAGHWLTFDEAQKVHLHPFTQVTFATDSGIKHSRQGYAGTLRIKIEDTGVYRFRIDSDVDVEVADNGRVATPAGSGAVNGCSTMHRYVDFELVRGEYVLQLSGSKNRTVKILAMETQ